MSFDVDEDRIDVDGTRHLNLRSFSRELIEAGFSEDKVRQLTNELSIRDKLTEFDVLLVAPFSFEPLAEGGGLKLGPMGAEYIGVYVSMLEYRSFDANANIKADRLKKILGGISSNNDLDLLIRRPSGVAEPDFQLRASAPVRTFEDTAVPEVAGRRMPRGKPLETAAPNGQ